MEVEEDELGVPVTASYHVQIPPQHNGVFQVNVHGDMGATHIIMGNKHLMEKQPNMFQHEISIICEKEHSEMFVLFAITNLDQVKILHFAKGGVVSFAMPESPDMTYIATTNKINIEEQLDNILKNWTPKRKQMRSEYIELSKHLPVESSKSEETHKQSMDIQFNTGKMFLKASVKQGMSSVMDMVPLDITR